MKVIDQIEYAVCGKTLGQKITKIVEHSSGQQYDPESLARAMCVLEVWKEALARRIWNREIKIWAIHHRI